MPVCSPRALIRLVSILLLLLQPVLGSAETTYLPSRKLNAKLTGQTQELSFNGSSATDNLNGVLTLVHGGGQDLRPKSCSGSLIARLLCGIENLAKAAVVLIDRPVDVQIQLNGTTVISRSNYSPAAPKTQVAIKIRKKNQLKITLKGLPTASVNFNVKGETGTVNQPPIAAFEFSPTQGRAPETVIFNASSSRDPDGTLSVFEWDFGDGSLGTGMIVPHLYAQAGNYNIKLTVRDAAGAASSISKNLNLSVNQAPVARMTVTQDAADPRRLRLDGSASSDPEGLPLTYRWSIGGQNLGETATLDHVLSGDGQFTIRLSVADDKGLSATTEQSVNVAPNLPPTAILTFLSANRGTAPFAVAVSARSSTDPNGDALSYEWDFAGLGTASNMDASFVFEQAGTYTVTLVVRDPRGGTANAQSTVRVLAPNTVPDPKDNPQSLANSDHTLFSDQVRFLHQGENATQIGVVEGALNELLVSVLRGQVKDEDGNPIAGVRVHSPENPSYGHTFTRADGEFDLVVNGGAQTLIRFDKTGYLFVDRPWAPIAQESFTLDDVILLKPDPVVTTVLMNSPTSQSAQGSVITDQDGARKGTLIVPSETSAWVVRPDGSKVAMANLNLRITEYTRGIDGPKKMPAPLPPGTGYTYAMDVSADEALALGSKHIEFSKPVSYYVNNFLGFPVGSKAPVGVYDETSGQWIGIPDGQVLKIIGEENGRAVISYAADGSAASAALLQQLGIDNGERARLLEAYPVGSELWRVSLSRFSPVDINWVWRVVTSTPPPAQPPYGIPRRPSQDHPSNMACGSMIDLHTLTVRESVPLIGTGFSAHYHSRRTGGYTAKRRIDVPLIGSGVVPSTLQEVGVELHVAGQVHRQKLMPSQRLATDFYWNGKDAYGRNIDTTTARIRKIYRHATPYLLPSIGTNITFGSAPSNLQVTSVNGRSTLDVTIDSYFSMQGTQEVSIGRMSLAGWSLDPVHRYDTASRTLHLGSGDQVKHDNISFLIDTYAGVFDAPGSGAEDLQARASHIHTPGKMALGPDGSVYFADNGNHRVRRIFPDGRVVTVLGNGQDAHAGDGGPAINASIRMAGRMAVMADGSLIVPDPVSKYVRKVSPEGIVTTIAGAGPTGGLQYDSDPLKISFTFPHLVGVMPDQSIIVLDSNIYRIGVNGITQQIASRSNNNFPPALLESAIGGYRGASDMAIDSAGRILLLDGGQLRALEFGQLRLLSMVNGSSPSRDFFYPLNTLNLTGYHQISINARGEIVLVSNSGQVVYVDSSGNAKHIAGLPSGTVIDPDRFLTDNQNANLAWIKRGTGALILDDGSMLIADADTHRIRRISTGLPSLNLNGYNITSQDGSEIYQFDLRGRHLRTLTSRTGATKWLMVYNESGHLMSISDGFGNISRIERDEQNRPLRIVAPFGQVTQLATDAQGYLAGITDPAGHSYAMTYEENQLLRSFTKPDGQGNTYTYNEYGEVLRDDTFGGNGFWQSFVKSVNSTNQIHTRTTSGGKVDQFSFPLNPLNNSLTETRRSTYDGDNISTVTGPYRESYNSDSYDISHQYATDPRLGSIARTLNTRSDFYTGFSVTENFEKTVPRRGATFFDFTEVETRSLVRGNETKYVWTNTYDSRSRTDQLSTPMARIFETTSDAYERPVRVASPQTAALLLSYDNKGRLSGMSQSGRNTSFSYGVDGLLSSITDSLNRETRLQRDGIGRVVRSIGPNSEETGFNYNSSGNLVGLTTPTQMLHEFLFDLVGNPIAYVPAGAASLGGEVRRTFNVDGDLVDLTRADGRKLSYLRDANFRVNRIVSPMGTLNVSYQSDPNNVTFQRVRRASNVNETVTGMIWETLVQVKASRTSVTKIGNVNLDTFFAESTRDFTYGRRMDRERYTINGRGSTNTFPVTIDILSDMDGLTTRIGDMDTHRDPESGRMTGTTLQGVTTQNLYNALGEIQEIGTSFNGQALYRESYERDNGGRIVRRVVTTSAGVKTLTYAYDAGGRLSTVHENGALVSQYSYSANGHRSGGSVRGRSISSVSDAQDRVTSYSGNTYQYSPDGEMVLRTDTNGASRSFQWNEFGQLIEANVGTNIIRYTYDGYGRRLAKRGAGSLNRAWGYRSQTQIMTEFDENGLPKWAFVYGSLPHVPDYLLNKAGERYRLVHDHVGSVVMVVNATTGAIAQQLEYDEFGNVLTDSNPGFQPFGFAGGLYDPDTGLVRFGVRDYDPETGRWLSKDPIGFAGGDTNLYAYVANDPVNFIDPSGNFAVVVVPFIPPIIQGVTFVGSAIGAGWGVSELANVFSKQSGKEKASNIPSWAKGKDALPGEKPKETAERIVKEKYGPNYDKGPGSPYNQIKKYFERKPKKSCP